MRIGFGVSIHRAVADQGSSGNFFHRKHGGAPESGLVSPPEGVRGEVPARGRNIAINGMPRAYHVAPGALSPYATGMVLERCSNFGSNPAAFAKPRQIWSKRPSALRLFGLVIGGGREVAHQAFQFHMFGAPARRQSMAAASSRTPRRPMPESIFKMKSHG